VGVTKEMVQFGTTPTINWAKQFNWAKKPKEDKNNDQTFSRSNRCQAG
jgi:hypothetical protein